MGFDDIGQILPEGTNVMRDDIGRVDDDPSRKTCQDDPYTANTDELRASYCQRIDYIFVSPKGDRLAVQEVNVEKFDRSTWEDMPTLSDYVGVSARLRWIGAQDPLPGSPED